MHARSYLSKNLRPYLAPPILKMWEEEEEEEDEGEKECGCVSYEVLLHRQRPSTFTVTCVLLNEADRRCGYRRHVLLGNCTWKWRSVYTGDEWRVCSSPEEDANTKLENSLDRVDC
ncbi:hypothetical protein E2C01_003734 [Portunus trituberculatus]|uniref:Uncharacterized protein n=1 Tax=Portunus trituberculatus TaxID=210409 RepID=A0A5B7CMX3_PORTR|nr:hypothetical protein [Portunus trituberculatus]